MGTCDLLNARCQKASLFPAKIDDPFIGVMNTEEKAVEDKKKRSSKPSSSSSHRERPRSSRKSRRSDHVTDASATSHESQV